MITINLFGRLKIARDDGTIIVVNGAKTQGLIAYLALNMDVPPTRDRLIALLWGDRFTDQARQSLRQAIAKLKRTFDATGDDLVLTDNDRVGLNPRRVGVDVEKFFLLAADPSPEAALEAMHLMTGPVLEGLYGQQPDFEDWLSTERQRVDTQACKVLERAAAYHVQRGQTDTALSIARQIIALDPLRDASQMVLIRILAQSGERAAALQQYNTYGAMLKTELGVGPGPELHRLIQEVRGEGFLPSGTASAAAPASATDATALETGAVDSSNSRRAALAVVPFATLGGDAEQGILAAGLAEDVTTSLSRYSWLDVRASLDLEGSRLNSTEMRALAQNLGLEYVLHGSLRMSGDRIRLTVQLAEPSTGRYLWVTRYDRIAGDLFTLQDELSETIAASVEAELERIAGRAAQSVAFEQMNAWECYHRGLAIQYQFSAETNAEAQRYFRRAIELDPNFALAHARLSYAMVISAIYFEAKDLKSLMDEALDLAKTAAKLAPEDAVARFALGRVFLARGEYDRSIAELDVAIDLNPGMAQAHCGLGDSKAYTGDLDDAMTCFEEAVRISPNDPYRWAFLSYGATALLFKGNFEQAVEWAIKAETVPNAHYWPTAIRASALGHLGALDRAAVAVAELRDKRPGIDCDFVRERLFYLRDPDQIDIYVDGLRRAGLS